jgi:hypothetical protein
MIQVTKFTSTVYMTENANYTVIWVNLRPGCYVHIYFAQPMICITIKKRSRKKVTTNQRSIINAIAKSRTKLLLKIKNKIILNIKNEDYTEDQE